MSTNKWNNLLAIVSPDLVAKYESQNLPAGVTLAQVSEDYKAAEEKVSSLGNYSITFMGCTVSAVILMAAGSIFLNGNVIKASLFVLTGWILFVSFFLCTELTNKKIRKARSGLRSGESILQDFQKAVEALGSPFGATEHEYTEQSVRRNFVTHAARILDAEIKLDAVRNQTWRDEYQMLHLTNFLLDCRRKFETESLVLKAKFGLEFDNSRLFADAKKQLQL